MGPAVGAGVGALMVVVVIVFIIMRRRKGSVAVISADTELHPTGRLCLRSKH